VAADPQVSEVIRRAGLRDKVELLLESECWPRERLRRMRDETLGRLLAAARETPFWSERLDGATGIEELPLLDRETLRSEFHRMRLPGDHPALPWVTSGSTGRPVRVVHGPETFGYETAARRRQYAWFGLPPRVQPEAGLALRAPADAPLIRRTFADPPTFAISPWKLDADTLAEVHERLLGAGGVRIVEGQPSSLVDWAALYEDGGLDARALGARLAVTGGEMVHPEQRERVERAFGCPTASIYGGMEVRVIASECPAGSLHVNEELALVEIMRRDGSPAPPGERGELVVTSLHNRELPLIRYRLGDVAAIVEGPCSCGRSLRRLDLQVAKLEEHVVCRDGRLVYPRFLRATYEAELGEDLVAFHTVQDGPGSFVARLELSRRPPPQLGERLERALAAYLREPVTVRVSLEPGLAAERAESGKLRTFTRLAP
jgi:phenylacetate-CoA ligase